MAIKRGMSEITPMTGLKCPKAARDFCWNVLHIYWDSGHPAVDENVFQERMRAYNEGTLDDLLRKFRKKNRR